MHPSQIAILRRVCRSRSVILGYHGVARCARRDDLSLLQVDPGRFRTQIESLVEAGFSFRTVAELAQEAEGGTPPAGRAVISFDDAMHNNLTNAFPILEKFGIAATVYAATDWLGGRSPWIGPEGDGAILNGAELKQLADAGWEVGAHTATHADLSRLDYEGCLSEIQASCIAIESLTGARPLTLAYPFGYYGPAAVQAAQDAELIAAVTTGSGCWNAFELTRAMVGAIDPFPIILLKMMDRYEPLLASRPMRMARQASKDVRAAMGRRRQDAAT